MTLAITRLLTSEAQIVTRTRTGPPDDFGTPTWEEATATVRCHIQPAQSDEFQGPSAGEVTWVGWFPVGTTIGPTDKIVMADSRELEVVGPARVWTNPRTAQESHIVIDLVEAS